MRRLPSWPKISMRSSPKRATPLWMQVAEAPLGSSATTVMVSGISTGIMRPLRVGRRGTKIFDQATTRAASPNQNRSVSQALPRDKTLAAPNNCGSRRRLIGDDASGLIDDVTSMEGLPQLPDVASLDQILDVTIHWAGPSGGVNGGDSSA